jgi:hypothetical protein
MERGKVSKVENVLLIAAVGIAAVLLVFVIYTIQFLSHNLLDALAPSGQGAPAASFNIAGAQALGL